MNNNWRNYELVVIIGQDIPPSQVDICTQSYNDAVQKFNGNVVKMDRCGLRSLAYEIQKNKRGYYLYFQLQLDADSLKHLDDQLRFDKHVIRYLFVRVEEFGDNYLVANREDDSSEDSDPIINYKHVYGLRKYMNVVSKILGRRVTKLPLKVQRRVAKEISRARFLSLIGYGA